MIYNFAEEYEALNTVTLPAPFIFFMFHFRSFFNYCFGLSPIWCLHNFLKVRLLTETYYKYKLNCYFN